MSIGAPTNLGTLLIRRLEAALGTTLSQQVNLVPRAQPNAVTQPGNPENISALQNSAHRHPHETVEKTRAQDQGQTAIGKATDAQAAEGYAGRSATPSAPTTLGFAARTILALLAKYPESAQLAQGHSPLVKQAATPKGPLSKSILAPAAEGTTAALSQGIAANHRVGLFSIWPSLAATMGQSGALSTQFAQSMAQAMRDSGLFYESHLANLAFGKTTAQALRQEPQGQIRLTPPTQQGPIPAQGAAVSQDMGASTTTQSSHQSGSYSATSQAGPAPTNQSSIPGLDPQTQLLVRQQLEVFAHQSFAWQGLAWPGAVMHWKVERRDQDVTREQTESEKHWATYLNLQLPALGEVQAHLTLAGNHLVMHLVAPESADHLKEHVESLRERLLAHGLKDSQLSIKNREDPHNAH